MQRRLSCTYSRRARNTQASGFLVSRPHELTDNNFAGKIENCLRQKSGRYLVAEEEGELLGYAMFDPFPLEASLHLDRAMGEEPMQPHIHDAAAKGFQLAPDSYDRGRPEYPSDAVQKLIDELALGSESVVVDLGAGTGILTKLLIPTCARLVAVDPVEGMRRKFSELLPGIEILEGSAEHIPLPDQSANAVVAAQAFHWFDGSAALHEINRVLKVNGKLGLIWNVRDESLDWVAKLTDIIDRHEKGAPRYRSGLWKDAFRSTGLFTPLQIAHFKYVQSGEPERIVDRVSSISFISALPENERILVLEEVRDLLRSHPMTKGRTTVELPYRTDVFWCMKKEK